MKREELLKYLKENVLNKQNKFIKSRASEDIIDKLIEYTDFFVSDRYDYLSIRVYFLLNNINGLNKCKNCNNYIKNIKSIRDYEQKEYCSQLCVQQSKIVNDKKKTTLIENYGVDHPSKSEIIKDKRRKTNIERYGNEHAIASIEVKEKIKQTNKQRYGVTSTLGLPEIREKIKQTNIERYGNEYAVGSEALQQKIKNTNLEKYNVNYPFELPQIQDKIKNTNLEKYGVDNPMKNPDIKDKANNSNLLKYGTQYPSHIHLPKETSDILNSKELFIEFIKDKTVDQISRELYLNISTIYKRIIHFDIDESQYIKKTKSKYEDQIEEFLIKNNINYIKNTKKILKNYRELDFYIPDYDVAIELNSLYYHCEFKDNKNKWYHYNKWKECNDMNITLLSIFDDEWIQKQDIIKNKILILCNKGNKGTFARHTFVKEIDKLQSKEFLSKYHLIGDVNSTVKLGTFYHDKLIGVMTFVKKDDGYILNRYCSDFNINTGIFSKMLTYFINNYNPKFITSFSDNRYSNGEIYNKNRFKLEYEIDPDYYVTDYRKRYHKFNFRKNNIKQKFNIDIDNETEVELLKKLGYDRLWDCGKKKWTMPIYS